MTRHLHKLLKGILFILTMTLFVSCKSVASYYKTTKEEYTFVAQDDDVNPKKVYATVAELPVKLPNNFIWGINGHTIDSKPYNFPGSLDLQMELLKELQLTQYRVNVTLDQTGEVNYWPKDALRWQETLEKSKDAGITIFPVIQLRDFDYAMSVDKAYTTAKKQTAGFAKKYGADINHYALGNEVDLQLVISGKDGSKVEHYDLKKFDVWIAFLKGMAAGIRQEDPTAQLVINGAGRHYYGYYQYIKQQQVDYDIIGFHWYSEMGKIPEPYLSEKDGLDIMKYMHQQFDKPIWITEINQHWGVNKHSENHQAFWMDHFIDKLQGRDYIKAFFVYELFDQPHLDDDKGYENKRQAYFGIIDWLVPYTSYRYRPAAFTYKYKIEEIKRGQEHYILAVADKLSLSSDEKNELQAKFSQQTSAETAIKALLSKIDSQPLLSASLGDVYQSILDRKPFIKEEKYWQKKLKKKQPQDLIVALLTSQEFYKNAVIRGYELNSGYKFFSK